MQKLLSKFRQTHSAADALRLLNYCDKHPFAVYLSPGEDLDLIAKLARVRDRARSLGCRHDQ